MNFFTWLSSLFKPKPPPPRPVVTVPNVYLLTGLGGKTWSDGFEATAQSIRDSGRTAEVVPFEKWIEIADRIIESDAVDVCLVAHSFGCGAALKIARRIRDFGIDVRCVLLLDPSEPGAKVPEVPANVGLCVEWYCIPTTILLDPGPRAKPASGNVRTRFVASPVALPINHMNIDNNPDIRRRIVEYVRGA